MKVDLRKLTVFYNYKGAGYSESYYSTSALADVVTQAPELIKLRLAFADDDVQAVYGRVSNLNVPRQTDFLDLIDTPGMTGKLTEDGCSPTDAILLRFFSTGGRQSSFYLHAFPAKMLKETKVVDKGKYLDKVEAWANHIGSQQSSWTGLFTTQNVLFQNEPVTSAVAHSPRGYTMTMENSPALVTAGATILVSGASQDSVGYGGRKIVRRVSVADKTIRVGGAKPVGSIGTGATVTLLTPGGGKISKIKPVRLTEHKVGKPFALPVGRRSGTLSLRR